MWIAPAGTALNSDGWTMIGHVAPPTQIELATRSQSVDQIAELMSRARWILTLLGVPEERVRQAMRDIANSAQPQSVGHREHFYMRRHHDPEGYVTRDECTGPDTWTVMPSTGRGDPFADLIGRIDEVTG